MESIKRVLFEDPLYVYITLGFVELVLAVVWHEKRSRKWLAALAIPPVLAVAAWGLAAAVVTDREQIIAAAHRIADDAAAGSAAAIEEYLDDDYRGYGMNKAGVVAVARMALKTYRIQKVGFTRMEIAVAGERATMHAGTIITFESGKTAVAFDVRWVKRPGGWRILEADEPTNKLEL